MRILKVVNSAEQFYLKKGKAKMTVTALSFNY